MNVPYGYLKEQFANPEAILADIADLLKSGRFTLGPAVAEFEAKFAGICGARYAVGVGSGTDALFLRHHHANHKGIARRFPRRLLIFGQEQIRGL